jgi:hypothetical protein
VKSVPFIARTEIAECHPGTRGTREGATGTPTIRKRYFPSIIVIRSESIIVITLTVVNQALALVA